MGVHPPQPYLPRRRPPQLGSVAPSTQLRQVSLHLQSPPCPPLPPATQRRRLPRRSPAAATGSTRAAPSRRPRQRPRRASAGFRHAGVGLGGRRPPPVPCPPPPTATQRTSAAQSPTVHAAAAAALGSWPWPPPPRRPQPRPWRLAPATEVGGKRHERRRRVGGVAQPQRCRGGRDGPPAPPRRTGVGGKGGRGRGGSCQDFGRNGLAPARLPCDVGERRRRWRARRPPTRRPRGGGRPSTSTTEGLWEEEVGGCAITAVAAAAPAPAAAVSAAAAAARRSFPRRRASRTFCGPRLRPWGSPRPQADAVNDGDARTHRCQCPPLRRRPWYATAIAARSDKGGGGGVPPHALGAAYDGAWWACGAERPRQSPQPRLPPNSPHQVGPPPPLSQLRRLVGAVTSGVAEAKCRPTLMSRRPRRPDRDHSPCATAVAAPTGPPRPPPPPPLCRDDVTGGGGRTCVGGPSFICVGEAKPRRRHSAEHDDGGGDGRRWAEQTTVRMADGGG